MYFVFYKILPFCYRNYFFLQVVKGGDSRELLIRALPQCYGKCTGIFHLQMAGR